MKIRVHFNKRAKNGLIWSLVTSKACYHARHVIFTVPAETEYHPKSKYNPKAFILAHGKISMKDGVAIIINV